MGLARGAADRSGGQPALPLSGRRISQVSAVAGRALTGLLMTRSCRAKSRHPSGLRHVDGCLDFARHEREAKLGARSEEHTSELQSLMRISYAVFCLKKKKKQ